MKTIRRRAASPTVRWRSAGANRQYSVTVRNEDTGDRQTVYEGYRQECRLPPELRLTGDQLSFRVASRDADDPDAAYSTVQSWARIARYGDELQPDAPDVLRAEEVAGATAYRFLVREALSQDMLVDMIVDEPWALLPPGQIKDRDVEWSMRPRVGGGWKGAGWTPVEPGAIAAARLRAETLIVLPSEARVRPTAEAAVWPVPQDLELAPSIARAPALAIAVAVSARPDLAPEPSALSVLETQWSDGHSGGATEQVARMLEAAGLRGWFFLDVEMGDALGSDAIARLAERLSKRGHEIGLYIGQGDLPAQGKIRQRLRAMLAGLPTRAHAGVMLGAGPDRQYWLGACIALDVPAVIVSRAAQLALPAWMRWRTGAFAASPKTIVIPTATFLSTPAHARDRVTRHALDNRDAMAAANIGSVLGAMTRLEATRLIVAEIDPLLMLDRRFVEDPDAAHAWNSTLKQLLPTWFERGWKRSVKGHEMARHISEIRLHLLTNMLEGLAAVDLPWARWSDVFDPASTSGWLPGATPFDPIIEKRRGPRRMRNSAVRRYDDAFRLALRAEA